MRAAPVLNVLRRAAGRYAVFLLVTTVVVAAFQLIIPAVISTLDMENVIGNVLAMLPPGIGAALGDQVFGGLSTVGLLGFGWNHPIAHAAGTALAVVLAARAVAGEIENGTLELVLAQPISRAAYLGSQVAFGVLALTVLCAAGTLATFWGTRAFGIEGIAVSGIVRVAASFLLLLLALYAVTLLASAFLREGGRALGIGFLVAVTSFLVHTVALLWTKAAFLKPYTLHAYYLPRDVLTSGRFAPLSLAVLGGCTVVCIGGAFWHFARRNVP
jgi:ABC-2 type transport system permease protein